MALYCDTPLPVFTEDDIKRIRSNKNKITFDKRQPNRREETMEKDFFEDPISAIIDNPVLWGLF